jgi:putative flippase GtrA
MAPWVRWFRHLAAGGVGTLLYLAAVAAGVELLGYHPVASVVVAFTLLVIFSYTVNRTWVYAPKRGHGYAIPRFLVGVAIGFLLNTGIMYGMVEVLDLWYIWGLVGAAVIVPPTNFLINYLWAFR